MSNHYIEKGRQKYLYMSGMFLLNEEIKPKRYAIVKYFLSVFTVSVNRFLQKLFTLKWPYTSSTE